MRFGKLTLQFIVVLCLLPAIGLALAGTLNYLKFERVLTTTAAARYDPVLRDLVQAIGNSLEEGLTLASTRSTERLLVRSTDQFEHAFELTATGLDGTVLYETRPGGAAAAGAAEIPGPGEILYTTDPETGFTSRAAIFQAGRPVGMLTLAHAGTGVYADLPELPARLRFAAIVSLVPILPLFVLGCALVLGRLEGRIEKRGAIVGVASEPGAPDPGPRDPLLQAVWRVGRETGDAAEARDA